MKNLVTVDRNTFKNRKRLKKLNESVNFVSGDLVGTVDDWETEISSLTKCADTGKWHFLNPNRVYLYFHNPRQDKKNIDELFKRFEKNSLLYVEKYDCELTGSVYLEISYGIDWIDAMMTSRVEGQNVNTEIVF